MDFKSWNDNGNWQWLRQLKEKYKIVCLVVIFRDVHWLLRNNFSHRQLVHGDLCEGFSRLRYTVLSSPQSSQVHRYSSVFKRSWRTLKAYNVESVKSAPAAPSTSLQRPDQAQGVDSSVACVSALPEPTKTLTRQPRLPVRQLPLLMQLTAVAWNRKRWVAAAGPALRRAASHCLWLTVSCWLRQHVPCQAVANVSTSTWIQEERITSAENTMVCNYLCSLHPWWCRIVKWMKMDLEVIENVCVSVHESLSIGEYLWNMNNYINGIQNTKYCCTVGDECYWKAIHKWLIGTDYHCNLYNKCGRLILSFGEWPILECICHIILFAGIVMCQVSKWFGKGYFPGELLSVLCGYGVWGME